MSLMVSMRPTKSWTFCRRTKQGKTLSRCRVALHRLMRWRCFWPSGLRRSRRATSLESWSCSTTTRKTFLFSWSAGWREGCLISSSTSSSPMRPLLGCSCVEPSFSEPIWFSLCWWAQAIPVTSLMRLRPLELVCLFSILMFFSLVTCPFSGRNDVGVEASSLWFSGSFLRMEHWSLWCPGSVGWWEAKLLSDRQGDYGRRVYIWGCSRWFDEYDWWRRWRGVWRGDQREGHGREVEGRRITGTWTHDT